MGSVVKPLVPGLFAFWLCVFLVIGWGVAIYGMISGALNVVVLILWLAVLAKGFSAFGDVSSTGMAYYFYPNISAHNFFAAVRNGIVRYVHILSIFGGLGVSFGKFSGQGTVSHISWLSLVVPVPIMLLLGTTLIAPYVAGLANHLNMDFDEVALEGPSALFILFTQALAIVENGASWLQIFHIMAFILMVIGTAYPMIVILDCLMSGFYKGILDRWLASEFVARLIVAAILCFASFIFSLPFILEGGRYLILCLDLAMFSLYPVFFVILTIGLIISYCGYCLDYFYCYVLLTGIFFEEKVIACSFAGVATLVVCVYMMIYHQFDFMSSQSTRYQVIGWISAILPFVIGAIAGTLDAFLRAPGDFIDKTVFMLMGEKDACPQSADVPMKPMEPMQEDPMLTGDERKACVVQRFLYWHHVRSNFELPQPVIHNDNYMGHYKPMLLYGWVVIGKNDCIVNEPEPAARSERERERERKAFDNKPCNSGSCFPNQKSPYPKISIPQNHVFSDFQV
ncbi:hypothetical protein CAPTEDRAFT_223160 [Capitella teleta]|uniref:Uncharacterized protein n=1 Tax=Capitella teleta TaxID=283909 RepID=R7VB69_CAPTE|nr:hypothetical protein CAPTEDRAFT_223160 [Capitella teleta]|eukprot:ELU12950.1 hypothetical protein CAPTEDRAFT_223160 [Capitella teleta]